MGKQIVSTTMKKINYVLVGLLGSAILFSCGESMKKVKEAQDGFEVLGEITKAGSEMMKNMKNLSEMEPLTHQDFEKWAPGDSFWGLDRTELVFGEGLADASVKMVYGNSSGGKRLEVDVVDGADQVGGAMLVAQAKMFLYSDLIKKELEKEGSDEQIVDKHGVRAKEYYSRGENTIETLINERFYVKLAGYDMSIEEVWDAFKALKTDKLK